MVQARTMGGQRGSSNRGAPRAALEGMRGLPATVGTREHEKPLMKEVLLTMRDMQMDMQYLKEVAGGSYSPLAMDKQKLLVSWHRLLRQALMLWLGMLMIRFPIASALC